MNRGGGMDIDTWIFLYISLCEYKIQKGLKAENTQEDIAKKMNVSIQTVSNTISNFSKNGEIAKIGKDFNPYLYTIWSINKQDKEVSVREIQKSSLMTIYLTN